MWSVIMNDSHYQQLQMSANFYLFIQDGQQCVQNEDWSKLSSVQFL